MSTLLRAWSTAEKTFPDMEMESLAAFLASFMCVNLSPQNTEQRLNTLEHMHKSVFHYIFTYVRHVENACRM